MPAGHKKEIQGLSFHFPYPKAPSVIFTVYEIGFNVFSNIRFANVSLCAFVYETTYHFFSPEKWFHMRNLGNKSLQLS